MALKNTLLPSLALSVFVFFFFVFFLRLHLKACLSALFKCFSVLLSWCIHENGEQCQYQSSWSHYCKVADYREQCLHSGHFRRPVFAVRHDESPQNWKRRRRLRTERLLAALVSPWHFIETLLLWLYFELALNMQILVCHSIFACFIVIYLSWGIPLFYAVTFHGSKGLFVFVLVFRSKLL